MSASLATAPDGTVISVDGTPCLIRQVLDVTARKTIELQLKRSNQDLTQFAYVASHDLSEPLRVVAGHVELLARRYRGQLDDDANRYIEFAVDGCARMRTLIDDLLLYSRVGHDEQGEGPLHLEAVVHDVLASLDIESPGIATVSEGLPTVIRSDSAFHRVLANLIGNAAKFTSPERRLQIVVDAVAVPDGWCVRVADNGIGVPSQYRELIFNIFQRLNRREDHPGTGIGLAVCRKLVLQGGGRIWVEDSPLGGARFCFTIPAVRPVVP